MQLLYKLIYHPTLNPVLLGIIKAIPGLQTVVKFPPSGIISLSLKNGKRMRLNTNQTCHVTSEVFWKGTSSYEYSDIFEKLFEKSSVFFDVGSNIGYYAIMAGVTNPNLKTYAFDPSPGPFAYLKDNVAINKLPNVFPFQMALSDENGSLSFQVAVNPKYTYLKYNSLGGGGHLVGVREDNSPVVVTVQAMTLDDFVSKHQISSLDLIKLDVEEAEHMVIKGGANTLTRFKPILVCEVFSNSMWENLRTLLKDSEYAPYIFNEGKLVPVSFTQEVQSDQIENYFFVPQERRSWITEFL